MGALWTFQKEIGPDLSLVFDFNTRRPKAASAFPDPRLYTAGKTHALILTFVGIENEVMLASTVNLTQAGVI